MDSRTRFQKLEMLFNQVVELDPSDRGAALEEVRREHPEILQTLVALLQEEDTEKDSIGQLGLADEGGEEQPVAIDHYRLVRRLGEGGMGEVFVADQLQPVQRRVALKLVRAGLGIASVLARFELERQALARMSHPGIAQIYDAGVAPDGRPYVVMELVEGLPVSAYAERHSLSTRERLELFADICDAVQHAHQRGVIHRDLKPSNILVDEVSGRPRPRIIDFGIAKAVENRAVPGQGLTRLGEVVGTLQYMSPEQAAGDDGVHTSTDVYSLGAVLYELLVGEVPHPTDGVALDEALRRIRERPTPRPSRRLTAGAAAGGRAVRRSDSRALERHLRGELDWIVMKALAKEPDRRYGTVLELRMDVGAFLDGRVVRARPDSLAYRAHKFVGRHRAAVVAGCVAILALIAAAIISTGQYLRADAARLEAERQRTTAEQVNAFLQSMIERADPVASQEREAVTVREALEQAAARIDSELAGQPAVAGALHRTVADAYRSLALSDNAERHYRRALETERSAPGDRRPEIIGTIIDLASLLVSQSRSSESATLLDEAEEMAKSLSEDRETWQAYIALTRSRVPELDGNFDQAEALLRAAVDGFSGLGHLDDEGSARSSLGVVLARQGCYEEAAAELRKTLAIWTTTRGEVHSDVAQVLNDLAWVLGKLERFDEALELQERALDGLEHVYGLDHPEVAIAADNLASVYRARGRFDDAATLQRRALTIFRTRLGPEHPNVAHCLNNIGATYREAGDYLAAVEQYRQAAEVYRSAVGEEHPWMAAVRYNLADALRLAGDSQAAERECREVLDLRRRILREGHPDIARSLHLLGQLRMDAGAYDSAQALIEQALAIRRRELPEGNVQIVSAERDLAACREALGNPDRSG